jgi:hypothetical protein
LYVRAVLGDLSISARTAAVLHDDEAVLYRAWIAHKTVHQPRCGENCEARQVLEDARDGIR